MSDVPHFPMTHDGSIYMTRTSPTRKSTLDLQIAEMENIFLNIETEGACNTLDHPSQLEHQSPLEHLSPLERSSPHNHSPVVPTISLPIPHDDFYPGTSPQSGSSNGSYSTGTLLSAPPSPSLGGFEGPRSLPGSVDWSEVLHSKMTMQIRPPESHSSYHGDDAPPEPTSPSCGSLSGDHYDHFATDGSHSSYDGASSPAIHSVASDFGDLRLNTDVLQHDDAAEWLPSPSMPSPGMLAPGPHHTGIGVRRWSSAGNQHQGRTHHRFASQQLSSPSEDNGMGRGRSLTRAASAPGSAPPSRRHSPYPQAQNVDTVYEQPGLSDPFHPITGIPDFMNGEGADVTVVKGMVTPVKIARAAALRRKNPAAFACDYCSTTFTTKFKRDSHVDAHAGKKEFACSTCGKPFTRKSDCVRHEKNTKKCSPSPVSPSPVPPSPVLPSPVSPS